VARRLGFAPRTASTGCRKIDLAELDSEGVHAAEEYLRELVPLLDIDDETTSPQVSLRRPQTASGRASAV
jgi:hypothetical protein